MSTNSNSRFSVRELALTGVMAALVFAASWISIDIPTAIDTTRLHMGNVMCLTAGLLLGPLPGGLAAGIGSMFFDLTNPLYIYTAPFTLVFKFLMAFVCGKIARSGDAGAGRRIVGGICGALLYVALYLAKSFGEGYFFMRLELETVMITIVQKGATSGINGLIAVVAAVPLTAAIRKGLKRMRVGL